MSSISVTRLPLPVFRFVAVGVLLLAAGCRTPVATPPPTTPTVATLQAPAADPGVASADVAELFAVFAADSKSESFEKVRAALVACADYDPYSTDLDDIVELVEQEKFDEAKTALAKPPQNLLLSPRFHWQAAVIADKTGSADEAVVEFKKQQACLTGILSTGNGTEERPYLVTRVDDEYDLLRHLNKQMTRQSLRHRNERSFDVIDTADGQEIWFDITDVFATLAKKLGAGK